MGDSSNTLNEIFSYYYKHNSWGSAESRSGPGSTLYESQKLRNHLPQLLCDLQVKTILDAPCGDFHWMKEINLDAYKYIGVDVVRDCIIENQSRYQKQNIMFLEKNIVSDSLSMADIVLCRDALVHLPNDLVKETIYNFQQSGSTYLLTTHFTNIEINYDIQVGDWRPINFTLAPFHFKEPLAMIEETLPIKTMALWKLDEL